MSLEGRQLGHYHLLQSIGSGGMGEIYLAEDMHMPRKVAIKVLRAEKDLYDESSNTPEAERLFQREMYAITQLDHPHILPVFDFGTEQIGDAALTYLVMPYRPEGSLLDWLRQRGSNVSLALYEVVHLLLQAADALQHAHERNILHQDIKPSNFLIRTRNSSALLPDLLLADFGIAKFVNVTATVSQSIRGTPTYMSPEQWEGRPVPASDQYSLAIMGFQLLTGSSPFRGSQGQVMHQHFTMLPPAPSSLNPRLSQAVDAVVLRALAKSPQERFPSVLQFAQALQQVVWESTSQATPGSPEQLFQASHGSLLVPQGQSMTPMFPSQAVQQAGTFANNVPVELLSDPQSARSIAPLSPSAPFPATSISPSFLMAQPASQPIGAMAAPSVPPAARDKQARTGPTSIQKFLLAALIALVVLGGSGIALAFGSGFGKHASTTKHTSQLTAAQIRETAAVRTANMQATAATTQIDQDATATATIANDLYLSGKGTLTSKLLISDPLTGPNFWKGGTSGAWGGTCTFANGAYHITQDIGPIRTFHCYANALQTSNFIFEVQMTILRGDCGGMGFRANPTIHQEYTFRVCADGTASLTASAAGTEVLHGAFPAIHQGFNQSNVLAVVANGSHIDLYVNKQKIGSVTDYVFSKGFCGLFANDIKTPADVAFRNAKIWQL